MSLRVRPRSTSWGVVEAEAGEVDGALRGNTLIDLSCVPPKAAGLGRYLISLTNALQQIDASFDLTCSDDLARGGRLQKQPIAQSPSRRPLRMAWQETVLPWLARRYGTAHFTHYSMPRAHPKRVRSVVTIHDLTFITHPEWHEARKVRWFQSSIAHAVAHADRLICVSSTTADDLRAVFPSLPVTTVIPHGVDLDLYSPTESEVDRRVRLEHNLNAPYVLFVGTLEPRKGVEYLLEAFKELAVIDPDVLLVLVGQIGWHQEVIQAALDRSPFASRIRRLEYVPEAQLPALYRQASIFCYPSLYEGFGLPVLEAMSCGVPVVTTSGSAHSNLLAEVPAYDGRLVPPRSANDIASALITIWEDNALRVELARAGRERAESFTWAETARRHLEVYG